MVFAKKSLGQHFLKDRGALDAIRDALDPSPFDVVLEIGPGQGALTENLKLFVGKLVGVEKDDNLYAELREKYKNEIAAGRLDFVHGDILEFDPALLRFYKDFAYKLVGNIPYNITGAILKKFLSASYQPELAVFLVQKEVAERIVAREKKESILSISVKAYGTPKIIKTVKAGSFNPVPKVDSAIICIDNISKHFFTTFSEKQFFDLLHAGFKSKRKKLSSNLATLLDKSRIESTFASLGLDPNTRAEDVSIDIWQKLGEQLL